MSHSVHLKAPPPDAGPFFESRAAHHRAVPLPDTESPAEAGKYILEGKSR